MTRNGQQMTVGSTSTATASSRRRCGRRTALTSLGDLNRDTCGGGGETGVASSYAWAVDDAGQKVVGTAYVDRNGNGVCEEPYREIVPFIWDQKKGMRELDTSNLNWAELPWVRAHAISGNGDVVLGTANFQYAYAWVKGGKAIDLTARYGALPAYAASYDGHKVALSLIDPGHTGARAWPCGTTLAG